MIPETWKIADRGSDQHGEWVWINRVQGNRPTSWKLYRTEDGWRIFKVIFSKENRGMNNSSEREKNYVSHQACPCHGKGIRLSDNRIDRTLLQLAGADYA